MSIRYFGLLPRPLQNGLITIYGATQYRHRYMQKLPEPFDKYFNEKHSISEVEQYRLDRLRQVVSSAVSSVPFYMRIYNKDKFNINKILPSDLVSIFPIINKSDIRSNAEDFINVTTHNKKRLQLNTSGSTGTPLTIYCTPAERAINYAFFKKIIEEYGVDSVRDRSITLAGRMLGSKFSKTISNVDYWNNTLYLSSYMISPERIEQYIVQMNNWNPVFIDSYPSALSLIADIGIKKKFQFTGNPKLILVSSETLSSDAAEKITKFFNAPIVDHYGSTEMVASLHKKNDQSVYNIDPLYFIPEYRPMSENIHSLIATGLINETMPLIRYDTGDLVEIGSEECNKSIKRISGRIDDIVKTPSGLLVGRLDPAFKGVKNILLSQIQQHEIDRVVVMLVVDQNYSSQDGLQLTRNLTERLGEEVKISIEIVKDIPVGKNGKFKSVVSFLE